MAFDGNGTARLNYGDLRLADGLGQATFGGWFNSPAPLTEGGSFSESLAAAGYDNLWLIGWDATASSAKMRVVCGGGPATLGSIITYSSGTYSANTWYHVVARVDYDNVIDHMLRLYVNGSSVGNQSVSAKDPFTSGMGATSGTIIGGFKDAGQGDDLYEDVRSAHMFFYDTCLTDAQIIELSKGRSPLQVRPQNLTFYAPVTDDTSCCDVVGGVTPTVDGTGEDYLYANPSPHFYPSAQVIPFTPAAAPPAGSYTIYNNYYRQLLAGNV